MKNTIVFLLFIFLLGNVVLAQSPTIEKFSTTDVNSFHKQLKKVLSESSKRIADDWEKIIEKNNGLTDEQVKKIAATCNTLNELRYRGPQIVSYIEAILAYAGTKGDSGMFDNWNEMIANLVKAQKGAGQKDFNTFMNFSKVYFTNNNLKENGDFKWRCNAEDFQFVYDGEPKFIYRKCDVILTGVGDTIIIKNTSGVWYVLKEKFVGNAGTMDWSQAGLEPEKVFATFNKFTIDANKSDIIIDSVKFTHKQYLNAPLIGRLTNRLTNRKPGAFTSSFPKFTSVGLYELQDISKGVKYKGGFGISGYRVIGSGVNGKPAEVKFYNTKDQLVAISTSPEFVIKKGEEIISNSAWVKIIIGNDSIFHPGCELRFTVSNRVLKLSRGAMGISKICFTDSYHQTDVNAEAIVWPIDSSKVTFAMITGGGKIPATFESYNYFDQDRLEKYTNIADFNPLAVIKRYCDKNKVNEADAEILAKEMNANYDENTIKRTLYNLTEEGFIFYDEAKHLVKLKEKATTYIKANRKLVDYDNIKIKSESATGQSAQVDLATNEIKIEGIKFFSLSDSNKVRIFPMNGKLTMQKNRDMDFGGVIYGGRVDFVGRKNHFNYKDFKINVDRSDSIMINIPSGQFEEDGVTEKLRRTKTFICGVSGDLFIDGPANKSGRVKLLQYPKLVTDGNSFTYYDDEKIHHKAYDKKKFYFKLEPFEMDSLNSFLVKNVHFAGTLISNNIFPDITEELRFQKDFSLGFQHNTDEVGLPLYVDKGTYKGGISLSNAGLEGKGAFTFMASTQKSNAILFTPDSLNALVDDFSQEATSSPVPFPAATNKGVKTHWLPAYDKMVVKMDTTPFKLFENIAKLKGNLTISSKGMTASGVLDWPEATSTSNLMKFGKLNVDADTSSIQIKTADGNIAFMSPNVKSKIDFEKRVGDFSSNTKDVSSNFVYNQYTTSINQFHWDMTTRKLDFVSSLGDTALFISKNAEQLGLGFVGKNAYYDLSTYRLKVTGIPYINSGDALILPDSGTVYIDPKAAMQNLKKAKVICDSVNRFHNIYDANVKIFSRANYLATDAKYDFNSKISGKQVILVDTLTVNRLSGKLESNGFSNIKEENNFALNKKMNFKGYFRFNSSNRDPSLDGFARLKLKSTTIATEWFTLNSVIKADSGTFNVVNAKNEKGNPIFFGVLKSTFDSISVYPAIFTSASTPNDVQIFVPQGTLEYNATTNDLSYGVSSKIKGENTSGDFVKFNDNTNKMYCDGKFNLGYNYQGMKVFTSGNATYDLNKNSIVMNAVVGLKIDINKELYNILVKEWTDITADKEPIDYKKSLPFYERAFNEFLTPKEVNRMLKPFRTVEGEEATEEEAPKVDYPKNTPFNLTFTDVKLMFDPFTSSWKSNCAVGLLNVNENYFGKKIYAYMEFGGKKGDDFFNIFFEASEADWYCFMYRAHYLQVISSNDGFNESINKIVPEKRKVIPDATKPNEYYIYQIGSDVKTKQFKDRLRNMRY